MYHEFSLIDTLDVYVIMITYKLYQRVRVI
jgi:hypothetical protein